MSIQLYQCWIVKTVHTPKKRRPALVSHGEPVNWRTLSQREVRPGFCHPHLAGAQERDSCDHLEEYLSLLGWTGHSTLVNHWELNARDVLTVTGLNRLVYRCCFHIPDVTFTQSNRQPRNVCIYPSEFVQLHSRDDISSRKKKGHFVILGFLPMNA